jgi:hypothetical protein
MGKSADAAPRRAQIPGFDQLGPARNHTWTGTARRSLDQAASTRTGGNPFDRIRQMGQTAQTFAPFVNAQSNFETAQFGRQAHQNATTFVTEPSMPWNQEHALGERNLQRLRDQHNLTAQSFGAQRQNMHTTAGFDRERFGLDEQSIRNQLQMLGLDRTDVGTDRRGIDADRHLIGLQRGFAGEDRDISTSEAKRVGKDRKLDINSDYTQRGAWFAPRRRTRQESNEQEMQATIQSANLGYRERIANLDRQATEADLREAKLDTLMQRLSLRENDLGIDLQRLGLDRRRLEQSLQYGLTMLGFDERMSLDNLMGMIDRGTVQQQQSVWEILEMSMTALTSFLGDNVSGFLSRLSGGRG